jgi:hypothetical protein
LRNKNKECLKDKINELGMNSKKKKIRILYREINKFKSGYQPKRNIVSGLIDDLFADFHIFSNRWKHYFYQLLNVVYMNSMV